MNQKICSKAYSESIKKTAFMMAVSCVRNTVIENYHTGTYPNSKTGDYSDVKVITPETLRVQKIEALKV